MSEDEIPNTLIRKAKSEIASVAVAMYLSHLEEQNTHLHQQVVAAQAELSQQKDHMLGLYQIMDGRGRDRRLAQVLCDWMNLHQNKKEGWKICPCELCLETKNHMNALGDPIIHTGRGWECTEGRDEFKTRKVAEEFVDNNVLLGMPITETSGIEIDEVKNERK